MTFKGPCYLALSILCSVLPKIPFQLLSTQLAQSLFVKRKPELNIAGKRWTGEGGRRTRTCWCKAYNYPKVIWVCYIICLNLLPSKQSFALSMMLLGLDSVDLGFQDHHCNSLHGWYPRYSLLRKLRSTLKKLCITLNILLLILG